MTFRPDVIVTASGWRKIKGALAATSKAARQTAKVAPLGEVTILLADDAALQALNHQFRGRKKPTNVLSFPRGQGVGDVALALETVLAEARAQGKTPIAHLSHLVVHGLLHLCGHDHMKKPEAARMETLEIAILLRLGYSNPYLSVPERRGARKPPRTPRP